MTVSQIPFGKLKIVLTKTEIIGCFGSYERLLELNPRTKSAINLLLREVIKDYRSFLGVGKIAATLKINKNECCEIVLFSKEGSAPQNQFIFEFNDFEALIQGVVLLFKNPLLCAAKSSVYKLNDAFRLIISSPIFEPYFLKEFGKDLSNVPFLCEATKEYGKPIIKDKAIINLGKTFFKEL